MRMSVDNQETALTLVAQTAQKNNPEKSIHVYDYKVIRYSSTLYNWNAVVVKKTFDGMLYDVTYDGYVNEYIIAIFVHHSNAVIPGTTKETNE